MEIELAGLNGGLLLLGIGLALMGYFVGKGLQHLGQPEKGHHYNFFIRENELEFYCNLNKNEIKDLLRKYPDAPKIELNGTTYYPYRQFTNWLASNEFE